MRVCRKCKGTNIRSRTNYSHGKKSKPIVSFSCKNCGSLDIEEKKDTNRRFKKNGQRH